MLLSELTPDKNKKDYLDAMADVFVVSDNINSTTDVEYQWLNETWLEIKTYNNKVSIEIEAKKETSDFRTIYKMGNSYYKYVEGQLIDVTKDLLITICDNILPSPNFIYKFESEIEYGGISYSIGNYLWSGYIFMHITVEEVSDISTTNFL